MITDDDAEKAVEFLDATATEAAQARANKKYMEAFTSVVEAQLMKEFDDGETSAVIQKRNARSDPRYMAQLDAEQEAVFQDAQWQFKREAKNALFEAWRTLSSNQRAARP